MLIAVGILSIHQDALPVPFRTFKNNLPEELWMSVNGDFSSLRGLAKNEETKLDIAYKEKGLEDLPIYYLNFFIKVGTTATKSYKGLIEYSKVPETSVIHIEYNKEQKLILSVFEKDIKKREIKMSLVNK